MYSKKKFFSYKSLIVALLFGFLSSCGTNTQSTENKTTEEVVDISGEVDMTTQEDITKAANKEIFKDQFSPYDGSHINFEYDLKGLLKDSDSYEHIETKIVEFSEDMQFMTIITKYKARNSFGGMVVEYKKAKIDLDGNTVEVYE
ncbi:hypothetical protein V9L05_01285 [Bernardetia sp. Wsw4-3y2]|uniref:hypothetical protein n=1 Tax=Bernardetia sp. Wsw4-3y2 TaxID=3127471 RepID=UPI0030D31B3F